MGQTIKVYKDYKPMELRDELLQADEGDAAEIHSACIALCNIIWRMESRLAALAKEIEALKQEAIR